MKRRSTNSSQEGENEGQIKKYIIVQQKTYNRDGSRNKYAES
jgi:hypothetical protein